MNEFINSNYSHAPWSSPAGVYRVWKNRSKSGRSITCNFYYVRVHDYRLPGSAITTIGKTKTREEAEALFLKYETEWQGEIPYFEFIDKRFRKP